MSRSDPFADIGGDDVTQEARGRRLTAPESGSSVIVPFVSATERAIAEARERFARYTLGDDDAGYDAIKEACRELTTMRTTLEARRKDAKADALAWGRKVDSEAKRLEAQIREIEGPLVDMREQVDAKRRAEKEAREAAERVRLDRLNGMVEDIRSAGLETDGRPAADLRDVVMNLETLVCDEATFEEFAAVAEEARMAAIARLKAAIDKAVAREAHERALAEQEAKLRAEQEEIARQKAEWAERERQLAEREAKLAAAEAAERAEKEARERREAESRAAEERKRQAEAEEAERARVAAIAREEREQREAAERERLEREAYERGQRELIERAKREAREAAERRAAAGDVEKLRQLAQDLRAVPVPDVDGALTGETLARFRVAFARLIDGLDEEVDRLERIQSARPRGAQ